MFTGQFGISADAARDLRQRHPYASDQTWVGDAVRTAGWETVNVQYLQGERAGSERAMRDLMKTLGIDRPRTPEEATELIALAIEVFAPDEGFCGMVTRTTPTELRIANRECPAFALMEQQHWLGVTACPSWHRRRGWLDALGVEATDTLIREKKWGDPACVSVVAVQAVA